MHKQFKVNAAELHSWFQLHSQVLGGVGSHLNASLRQVDADSQPLSHTDIRVLRLLESFLQSLQLGHCERSAAAALLLLVSIACLQNQLCWGQETKKNISHIFSNILHS